MYSKGPMVLMALGGGACIAAGLALSPELMIELGVMRKSLTSKFPTVREAALLEIAAVSWTLRGLGVLLLLLAAAWPRIARMPGYARLRTRDLSPAPGYDAALRGILNPSLLTFALMFAATLYYFEIAEATFDDFTLRKINKEDGFFETTTALFLFFASLQSLRIALGHAGHWRRKGMHFFLAALFFLMCGEEISWGQRILGFGTPPAIESFNIQGELNLHNLYGYFFDHAFMLAFFTWGVLIPLAYHFSAPLRQLILGLGIPVPSVGLAICMATVSVMHDQTVYRVIDGVGGLRIAEVREFYSAAAFLMIMNEHVRALLKDRRPVLARASMPALRS